MLLIQNQRTGPVYLAISNFDGKYFEEPIVFVLDPNREYVCDTSPEYFFCIMFDEYVCISKTHSKINKISIDRTIGFYDNFDLKYYQSFFDYPQMIISNKITDKLILIMKSHLQLNREYIKSTLKISSFKKY
jgi:hypothetical protein